MKAATESIARHAVRVGVVVGAFGLALAAVSQPSMAAPCSVERSGLHQRVYDYASRGTTALRNFTVRTRSVYNLDLREESDRYARESAAERTCLQAQVPATPAPEVPATADRPVDTASR